MRKSASSVVRHMGGLNPEDVAVETALAEEEPSSLAGFEDGSGLGAGGFLGGSVADEFDAEHQAHASGRRR